MLQANPTLNISLPMGKRFYGLFLRLSLEDEEPLAGADPESFGGVVILN